MSLISFERILLMNLISFEHILIQGMETMEMGQSCLEQLCFISLASIKASNLLISFPVPCFNRIYTHQCIEHRRYAWASNHRLASGDSILRVLINSNNANGYP